MIFLENSSIRNLWLPVFLKNRFVSHTTWILIQSKILKFCSTTQVDFWKTYPNKAFSRKIMVSSWMIFPVIRYGSWPDILEKLNTRKMSVDKFSSYTVHGRPSILWPQNWNFGKMDVFSSNTVRLRVKNSE